MPACVHTQDHDDDNWPGLAHRAHGSWLAIALIKRLGEGLAYTIPGHTCIIFSLGAPVFGGYRRRRRPEMKKPVRDLIPKMIRLNPS